MRNNYLDDDDEADVMRAKSSATGMSYDSYNHRSDFTLAQSDSTISAIAVDGQKRNGEGLGVMTKVQNPEWLEMFFAATGISGLQHSIEIERQRRAEDSFSNPNPEIYSLVASMNFEIFVAGVIILNCISIGFEASVEQGTASGLFSFLEHIFVSFFLIEWSLRVAAYGWVWIFEVTNLCDTALVFGTGVLLKWVLEPLGLEWPALKICTVLRALRLVRLARAVRLEPAFKELWILIHGLTTSARPLLWTLIIALIILYVFGVAATELVGRDASFQDDSETSRAAQEQFGDLSKSLFTMFQLLTLDTYSDTVVRPLMARQPALGLFFVFFVMLGVFVFWNLITAIIVDNAFCIAKEDQAAQAKDAEIDKRRELKTLADLFLEIDQDGSGELSKEEFEASLSNPKVLQLIDLIDVKADDLKETWDILDDGDGVLTIKEFTNGIRRMKGNAKAKDIIDSAKRLRITSRRYEEAQEELTRFHRTVDKLEHDVEKITQDTSQVLGLFHEMFFRLCAYVEESERKDRREIQKKQVAASLRRFSSDQEKRLEEVGSEYETDSDG